MQVKEKWSKFIQASVSDACHGTNLPRSVPRQQKQLERVLLLEVPRRQLPKSHYSPGEGHRGDFAEYVDDENIVSNRKYTSLKYHYVFQRLPGMPEFPCPCQVACRRFQALGASHPRP